MVSFVIFFAQDYDEVRHVARTQEVGGVAEVGGEVESGKSE